MYVSIIVLIVVLLALDLLWINYFMKQRYEVIIQKMLNKPIQFRYLPAIFAYIVMIIGIYYFAIKDKKTSYDALISGCLLGFIMYGVYDGTLYAVFPIDDIKTGILDVIWGTFVCGVSAYTAHRIQSMY